MRWMEDYFNDGDEEDGSKCDSIRYSFVVICLEVI